MTSSGRCGTGDAVQPRCSPAVAKRSGLMSPNLRADTSAVNDLSSAIDVSATAAFACTLCPAVFADGLALVVHERAHGATLRCSFCTRSFRLEGDLRRHRRRHGQTRPERAGPPAECTPDNVLVNSECGHVVRPGEGRLERGARVGGKSSDAEVAVVSKVDSENVSAEMDLSVSASASTSDLGVASEILSPQTNCNSSRVEDSSWRAETQTQQEKNYAVQAKTYPPRAKTHTVQTENNTQQVSNNTVMTAENVLPLGPAGIPIDSQENVDEALTLPFQCAVCHARFSRVSCLQKHVKIHSCRRSRSERGEAPRRSQRRRTTKRPINDDGEVCSSDADSGRVRGGGIVRRKGRHSSALVKRSGNDSKYAGKSSRVMIPRLAPGSAKAVTLLPISSVADKNRSEAGSETGDLTDLSCKSSIITRAVESSVSSRTSPEDEGNGETPSSGQQAAPVAGNRGTQVNPCRRIVRLPIALVRNQESDEDDAPVASTPPPSPLHSQSTAPTGRAESPSVSSDRMSQSRLETAALAAPSADPSSLPPSTTKTAVEIAATSERTDGQPMETPAGDSVLESEPKQAMVPGEFECDVCHRRLSHRHALARHRQMHFVRESFQCDKCPARYSRFDSLVTHSRKHASEATHRCSRCPKAYRLRSLLEYHEREHQKQGAAPTPSVDSTRFECTECGKTFSYMTALRRHARLHVGGERFYCELCPKKYSRFDVLVLHSRAHSKVTPFECVICARTFSQRRILEYHTRTHACAVVGVQPPFKCLQCARSFPDIAQLREHRQRHVTGRSFLCDICGKELKSANKLRRHVMTHTGERPLNCNVCGQKFVDSTSLTQHLRIHSGERPFQCHVCGKSFSRNITLKIHTRTHSGEKPYPCNVCGRAFTTLTQLTRHSRVHSGEKPYLCGICGRGFSQTTHRKVHMRTHATRPDDPSEVPRLAEDQQQQQLQHQGHIMAAPPPPPPPLDEPRHPPLHQHQQGQEHHDMYALQAGLPVVGPMDMEEGSMTLHFMQQ